MIVVCNYEAPECARMRHAVRQLPDEFPGEVRVEMRQLPAYGHPHDEAAAIAALAAHRQRKFWEMNDCLLEHQDSLDEAAIQSCANEAKLDMKAFAKDRTDKKIHDRMEAERQLVRRLGLLHTPAYTINGRLYVGWRSWELLRGGVDEERRQVDAALKIVKKLPPVLKARAMTNVPKRLPNALETYTTLVQHLHSGLAPSKP